MVDDTSHNRKVLIIQPPILRVKAKCEKMRPYTSFSQAPRRQGWRAWAAPSATAPCRRAHAATSRAALCTRRMFLATAYVSPASAARPRARSRRWPPAPSCGSRGDLLGSHALAALILPRPGASPRHCPLGADRWRVRGAHAPLALGGGFSEGRPLAACGGSSCGWSRASPGGLAPVRSGRTRRLAPPLGSCPDGRLAAVVSLARSGRLAPVAAGGLRRLRAGGERLRERRKRLRGLQLLRVRRGGSSTAFRGPRRAHRLLVRRAWPC